MTDAVVDHMLAQLPAAAATPRPQFPANGFVIGPEQCPTCRRPVLHAVRIETLQSARFDPWRAGELPRPHQCPARATILPADR